MVMVVTRHGRQEEMVPLVVAAQRLRRSYQQAHNDVLVGRLAGERIDGRWYVPVSAIGDGERDGGENAHEAREESQNP